MVILSSRERLKVTRGSAFVTLLLAGAWCSAEPSSLQRQIDHTPPGATLVLPPGHYRGQVHFGKPIVLRGAGMGETTIEDQAGVAAVVDSPGVELQSLTVTGMVAVQVRDKGALTTSGVDLWGGGEVVHVDRGGAATLRNGSATCQPWTPKPLGASVEGRVDAADFVFSGPCYRAIHVERGTLKLQHVQIQESIETAVQLIDSKADIDGLRASLPNVDGALLFAARSQVTVRNTSFKGGLESVLLHGGQATLSGVTITGAVSVGLSLNGLPVQADRLSIIGPFRQAAVAVVEKALLTGRDITIQRAGAVGVLALRAAVDLHSVRISGARCDKDGDFGHGVMIEESTAHIDGLTVRDAQGAGLYASDRKSSVTLSKSAFSMVSAGISVVEGAQVNASAVTVTSAGVGVAVSQHGRLGLAESTLQSTIGRLDCAGTHVDFTRVSVQSPTPRRACRDREFDTLLGRESRRDGG